MQLLTSTRSLSHKKRNLRRPVSRRAYVEAMESRTLLSAVLGGVPLDPNGPLINLAGGQTTYTASSGTLDVLALAPSFQLPPFASSPSNLINNPPYAGGLVTFDIKLNGSGNFVQSLTNLQITGTSGAFNSGILLTGVANSFSFDGTGAQMQIGITFNATGGDLAPFFGPAQVAMILTVEGSNFAGSFASDFTGGAKGNVGAISGSGSAPAGLGDYVWNDINHDGIQQSTETGLNGVTVKLLTAAGVPTGLTTTTHNNGLNDGFYSFTGLTPGSYKVQFVLPDAGAFSPAFQGANTTKDSNANTVTGISDVVTLAAGQFNPTIDAGIYEYTTALVGDMTATIGFWHNRNGQALIDSLNGGPSATNLSTWLSTDFSHLFGSLSGDTNLQVASAFMTDFNVQGTKTYAQVLGAALAVYVTDSDLAGTTAQPYGFTVNSYGTGSALYNVGSNGTILGLQNNTSYTVFDLLKALDTQVGNGVSYVPGSALFNAANTIFNGINTKGDI